jgi:FHS family Na+ dependent glucose MFS transporter 1
LGPTLPALAAQTNVGMKQISNLFIARSVGTMIGSLMIGRFYDRFNGHPLLAVSLLSAAVAMALIPSIDMLSLLLAISVFTGVAFASINVGGNALIVLVHGERVRPFMSTMHFAFGLGGFLSPMLVAQVVHRPDSLRITYWMLALLIIPVALFTLWLPSPPLVQHKTTDRPVALPSMTMALFALFFFLEVGAESGVMGWYFTYATERGMSSQTAAYVNSAFWAAFTLGRLATIWTAMRFNPVPLIVGNLGVTMLIGVSMLIFPSSPAVLWIGAAALGLTLAPIFPNAFGFAQRVLGLSGRMAGFFILSSSAGGMFWPWLIGQQFNSIGPEVMVWALLFNLAGALAVLNALTTQFSRTVIEVETQS